MLLTELYVIEGWLEHASRTGTPRRFATDQATPPSTPGTDREHSHLAAPPPHRTQLTLGSKDCHCLTLCS